MKNSGKRKYEAWSKKALIAAAPENCGKFSFVIRRRTASTNDLAKKLAQKGESRNTVIISDSQSKGRGRKDSRRFFSPKGVGIYMSVLLPHPALPPEEVRRLTPFVATAVAGAIGEIPGADAKIKWVNDIYIGGKKVCGILTESSVGQNGEFEYVVIGIGINVLATDFPPEIQGTASSIEAECGKRASRNALAAGILRRLLPILEGKLPCGFMSDYRRLSNILGSEVRVIGESGEFDAKAVDIDDSGRLIVLAGEEMISLDSGEVSIKL